MWLYWLPQRQECVSINKRRHNNKKEKECQSCSDPLRTWHVSNVDRVCYLFVIMQNLIFIYNLEPIFEYFCVKVTSGDNNF